ncbi:hypothetical protein B0T22DRAFT_257602 [Podospora appendiculata]|uniref:Uncharacterized protein n=1 Tax=Podospora appendiculata TaxID=314037 RepID=A0AAE1C948_9PEZI|nr:hypothetical protein B0T22DRAFT_257602 [Podospora appendiculata]
MKGTMDGAAKSITKVAQRILPDRPHHLSATVSSRYPEPSGFWFTNRSGPLQYMTYLSDAHRGVLMTRPSYDIYVETDSAPVPMPAKLLARGEVKKMSIKDYQNRKKSVSPADNDLAVKTDARSNGANVSKAAKENGKTEEPRLKEKLERRQDSRPDRPRPELNGDSIRSASSQPKPQPEALSRKRNAETDRNQPPQKRLKGETSPRPDHVRSSNSKPEPPRDRERLNEKPHKDAARESLHPTINGLPHPEMDRDRDNSASPRSTIQVNGTRARSSSGTPPPRRMDAEGAAKSIVPALLSPLHPSLFESEPEEEDRVRRRPGEKAPAKTQKMNSLTPQKRPRTIFEIPPLLSPTLPPIVEAELARVKKTPTKGDISQRSSQLSESPSSARKTRIVPEVVDDEEPSRPSLMVSFKLKKPNAKRAKELLSLPSKSAKNALKKERSISVDETPPPARKRPRPADEVPAEAVVPKRSKATAEILGAKSSSGGGGLATPLKPGATAMSRVTSSQSQANTPSNSQPLTLTPGTGDRRPALIDSAADVARPRAGSATIEGLKKRHEEYMALGTKLKHTRDNLCKVAPRDEKRITALHFEMVLSYMVAFYSLDQARMQDRKVCEIGLWEALLPHLHELKNRVATNRPLRALALQLNALCLEQVTLAFATLEPSMAAQHFVKWVKLDRGRVPMWVDATSLSDAVTDRGLKTLVGPWTKVEDAVVAALAIMRRWAERDGVQWRAVIMRERDKDREKKPEPGPGPGPVNGLAKG